MSDNIKILINYLLYFFTLIIICIIGVSNVFAISITENNYATKYYWYTADNNSSTTSTEYRTGSDNRVTLYGATSPTYTNGEGFNGFYNRVNYSITKGSIYTLSLSIGFNNLLDSEFSRNTINNRLFSTDFAHCSNCTITAVSGSIRRYNNTNNAVSNLYDFVVQLSYTFIATSDASTWYIGSYTGDDRTIGIDNHLYTSIVIVGNLDISNDNSSTIINQNDTIINQNQEIIDQNNQNTQTIIDNQNELLGSKCENLLNKNNYVIDRDNYLGFNVSLEVGKTYTLSSNLPIAYYKFSQCLFCGSEVSGPEGSPNSTSFTFTISDISRTFFIEPSFGNWITNISQLNDYNFMLVEGSTSKSYCEYGTYSSKLDDTNNSINNLDDTLKDDDTDEATSEASDFFSDFNTNTFGLTSIITAPLNLIQSLTSKTCSPLHLPLPYLNNKYLDLPCMSTIYSQHFGTFFTLYQTITYGIIAYWVCVRIFNHVKDFKNPEHDEIEVVDL